MSGYSKVSWDCLGGNYSDGIKLIVHCLMIGSLLWQLGGYAKVLWDCLGGNHSDDIEVSVHCLMIVSLLWITKVGTL